MEVGAKVFFGHGPLEFIGVVTSVDGEAVKVFGVEVGCQQSQSIPITVKGLSRLRILTEEEFTSRTANEPAFGHNEERYRWVLAAA